MDERVHGVQGELAGCAGEGRVGCGSRFASWQRPRSCRSPGPWGLCPKRQYRCQHAHIRTLRRPAHAPAQVPAGDNLQGAGRQAGVRLLWPELLLAVSGAGLGCGRAAGGRSKWPMLCALCGLRMRRSLEVAASRPGRSGPGSCLDLPWRGDTLVLPARPATPPRRLPTCPPAVPRPTPPCPIWTCPPPPTQRHHGLEAEPLMQRGRGHDRHAICALAPGAALPISPSPLAGAQLPLGLSRSAAFQRSNGLSAPGRAMLTPAPLPSAAPAPCATNALKCASPATNAPKRRA